MDVEAHTSTRRIRVLVLFGGRSSEHEVSCLSARNVLSALDRDRYVVTTVGITREGRWTLVDGVPDTPAGTMPAVGDDGDTVALVQSRKGPLLVRLAEGEPVESLGPVDVCFPVLHGPYGEDGTIQGLLASAGVAYVGADVASSAVANDKRQMKNVFAARGLPQVRYQVVRREDYEADPAGTVARLLRRLRMPVFTKPVSQGSSIGISKCRDADELVAGIADAFAYNRVALVEEGVTDLREIECGVLGNDEIVVTPPGETIHTGDYYDFDAKYVAPVELRCPADLPDDVRDEAMTYAREAYRAIGARGMARVDFFYAAGELYVNEIQTIPGFTAQSMFPAVWAAQGLDASALVDRLLQLALEAAQVEARYAP